MAVQGILVDTQTSFPADPTGADRNSLANNLETHGFVMASSKMLDSRGFLSYCVITLQSHWKLFQTISIRLEGLDRNPLSCQDNSLSSELASFSIC
jgi:hypothetical protein